jgi:hypothetical protein
VPCTLLLASCWQAAAVIQEASTAFPSACSESEGRRPLLDHRSGDLVDGDAIRGEVGTLVISAIRGDRSPFELGCHYSCGEELSWRVPFMPNNCSELAALEEHLLAWPGPHVGSRAESI